MGARRHKSIAVTVAMALAAMAGTARAQNADTPPAPAQAPQPAPAAPEPTRLEEIVVTGIRASNERSLLKKRDADSVMEVITADDIGKLPDKNVADAVQRVPGVNTMSGSGGEGGFSENDRVSIRGTNPSLTQTTINGHMVSSGDWYIGDQTNTVGRSVSFTLLPSEIVSSVEVQKSSQADYIEGGTAGNVNIVTRSPLDFKKPWTFEATAQALYADLPRRTDPQVNALVNWKNDANNLGALVQLFSESRHERRDGQELFLLGEGQITQAAEPAIVAAHPDLNNVVFPAQIGSAAFTQQSRREGGLFDVQYKASSELSLDFNGFYSHFNGTNFDTNFMASPTNEIDADISPTSYQVVNGTLVSATFPNENFYSTGGYQNGGAFPGIRDSIYRPNAGSSSAYADFDSTYKPSDALLVTTKVGFTEGIGITPHDWGYEAYLINSPLVYQMNGTASPANVSFPGVNTQNFNDPNHVINGGSWSDSVKVTDSETYGQADALLTLDNGNLESVKFGARYAFHKRTDFGQNYGCSTDPNNNCYLEPGVVLPKPAWNGSVSPGNFGTGIGAGPNFLSHFWVMNVYSIAAWETAYNSVPTGPNYQGNFVIEEKDAAAYAMANLTGPRWRGNVGLRLVDTSQFSSSYNTNNANQFVYSPVTHDYFYPLPSANLKVDVTHDLVARFAAAETMSRADYSALSPAVILNNIDFTGTGGNSSLKPIRSINYDADLEWYYARESLLSFGVFTMNMPSYVTYGYNTRNLLDTTTNTFAPFVVTSPYNVGAGNKGYELAWQQPLGWGFGAQANYTYADGHSDNNTALVGNSKSTWNAVAYFENSTFSARLAYTYRSSFLVGLANVTSQYAAPLGTLAASLNVNITNELALTFDGLNLNNPIIKYYSNAQEPQAFYSNGRQYFLGFRLKM
jgi:iron complex outermembrane receptor protein